MTKIFLLPDNVIDQIAAGEVLENPASAVKELIENSIDAGSSEIRIEIEGGGLQRLCIEDDGCGMNRVDAKLCLKRHATSKIRLAQDLDTLVTMGFRGEALAALASVSKLELKTSNGDETTRISAEGDVGPVARNRGTTIDARDLFYNAPARLKFQKSASACAAAILKSVQAVSLSNPTVSFHLFSNGKPTFSAVAKDWKARVEDVLGPFAHSIKPIEGHVSIKGLLGRPEEAKMNRSGQMIYVNRRPIQSPLIARAVKEGFGTRMQDSLFPVFCIFLEIPSDLVDVNVHPQKREVRFREEGRIYSIVRSAVMSAFFEETFTPPPLFPWEFTQPTSSHTTFEPQEFILQDSPIPLPFIAASNPKALLGEYLLVDQLSWLLVDLRGAESRILYDALISEKPAIQQLMWPFELQVKESAEELAELVKSLSIEARPLGPHSIAIDVIPEGIEVSQISDLIRTFTEEKSDRRLASALTKSCRSMKKNYSFEEACLIWKKLQTCTDQSYDPLGRKIKVEINQKQLAEQFT
jgi:DNA mismatch repair protein MutL